MARDRDPPFQRAGKDDPDGWLEGMVADEDGGDKAIYWRMSTWAFAAVAAVALGVVAQRSSLDPWTSETTAKYFEAKTAQAETVSREAQFEARRLAAAIETLNNDRDRIYARLSSIEQGFESVTGSIKAQETAIAKLPQKLAEPASPPVIPSAPASQPSAGDSSAAQSISRSADGNEIPLGRTGSIELSPDAGNSSLHPKSTDTPVIATEFGIDLGAATSMDGLRKIWRSTRAVHTAALAGLTPIVTIEERGANQPLRFRLVAGPLRNAADAARLCVLLMEKAKDCKTSVFDGQRLQVTENAEPPPPARRPVNRAAPAQKQGSQQGPRSSITGMRSTTTTVPPQVSLLPSIPSR